MNVQHAKAPLTWLGSRASVVPQSATGYPWQDGDILYAADLNEAISSAASGSGTFNLATFGAQSDGRTDDSAALNAAIAAILALPTGGKLVLPAGRTVIGSAITASIPAKVTLTIEGMGPQASELYFSNATDGLNFTLLNSGSDWGLVNLTGFALTRGPGAPYPDPSWAANTGISITGDPNGGNYAYNCMLRDLLISGGSARTTQWLHSVVLTGVGSVSDNVHILAPNGGHTVPPSDLGDTLMTIVGIRSSGPSPPPHFATANHISNCIFQGGSTGLLCGDFVQGVFVTNSNIIGNYDGIRCTNTPTTGQSETIQVNNCTFAAGHRDILLNGWAFCSVANNTLQQFAGAYPTGVGYAGLEVIGTSFVSVAGNGVTGTGKAIETGIIINGSSNCTVAGNSVGSSVSGASITLLSAVRCAVSSNACHALGADVTQDSGCLDNFVWGNTYLGTSYFTSFSIGTTVPVPCAIGYGNTGSSTPLRWLVGTTGGAETGGNAGSDWELRAFADDGATALGNPLTLIRATGQIVAHFLGSSTPYANDSAAAAGGIPVGGLYRNGSVVQVRVT